MRGAIRDRVLNRLLRNFFATDNGRYGCGKRSRIRIDCGLPRDRNALTIKRLDDKPCTLTNFHAKRQYLIRKKKKKNIWILRTKKCDTVYGQCSHRDDVTIFYSGRRPFRPSGSLNTYDRIPRISHTQYFLLNT